MAVRSDSFCILGWVRQWPRPNEQVTVLRHQHVTDYLEAQLRTQIIQGPDKFEIKAVGIKNPRPPIDVGCEVMKMILSVELQEAWH